MHINNIHSYFVPEDSLNCNSFCSGERQDVSIYKGPFDALTKCYINGDCRIDYPDISCWNTTDITDMSFAFSGSSFNAPLECWDVGQVKDMTYMFLDAPSFNQHIDSWDVSQVKGMRAMFSNAASFNQCLSTWAEKTSDGVDTNAMLTSSGCPNDNDPNATIGPWCQDNNQGCFAKSQKKKSIKKTKKQIKKKSKKM